MKAVAFSKRYANAVRRQTSSSAHPNSLIAAVDIESATVTTMSTVAVVELVAAAEILVARVLARLLLIVCLLLANCKRTNLGAQIRRKMKIT